MEQIMNKKILWFTNTPSLLAQKYAQSSIAGGWIPTLESLFHERKIELGIAFHDNVREITIEVYNGNKYYRIPAYRSYKRIFTYLRRCLNIIENEQFVITQYKKVIADFQPDLVQIWGTENAFGLIIPFLKVPHILHIQGNLTSIFNKYYIAFGLKQVRKSTNIIERIKCKRALSSKIYHQKVDREKKIFGYCKNIMGRTNYDRRIAKILSPGSNYVHCNEIMRNDFYNNKWDIRFKEFFTLLSVFRDGIYKGLETIYDTAHLLHSKGIVFEWVIAGISEKSFTLRLIKNNRKFSLKELPINLVGLKNAKEIINLYQQSDLFINTSHIDNSSNSVCEAMLLGIPVISSSSGGLQTIIDDDKTGFLVQDGDPWALAGAIMETMESYPNAIEVGATAREVALKRHDPEKIFQTVITTYKTLLNN